MVDNSASLTIYPHTTLTRLHEPGHKPTRKQILLVQLELDASSLSVDSVFGNHRHVFVRFPRASALLWRTLEEWIVDYYVTEYNQRLDEWMNAHTRR